MDTIDANEPYNPQHTITPDWTRLLAALMPSTIVTTGASMIRLPYATAGDTSTLVAAGTLVVVSSVGTLTLDATPATTRLQWYVVNANATTSVAVVVEQAPL